MGRIIGYAMLAFVAAAPIIAIGIDHGIWEAAKVIGFVALTGLWIAGALWLIGRRRPTGDE